MSGEGEAGHIIIKSGHRFLKIAVLRLQDLTNQVVCKQMPGEVFVMSYGFISSKRHWYGFFSNISCNIPPDTW